MGDLRALIERANSIHEKIAAEVPQLRRGMVWCYTCGREERVDSAASLKHGWPTCCGRTMSIDSPEERQQRATLRALAQGSKDKEGRRE